MLLFPTKVAVDYIGLAFFTFASVVDMSTAGAVGMSFSSYTDQIKQIFQVPDQTCFDSSKLKSAGTTAGGAYARLECATSAEAYGNEIFSNVKYVGMTMSASSDCSTSPKGKERRCLGDAIDLMFKFLWLGFFSLTQQQFIFLLSLHATSLFSL